MPALWTVWQFGKCFFPLNLYGIYIGYIHVHCILVMCMTINPKELEISVHAYCSTYS